jgi:hypothetical protein
VRRISGYGRGMMGMAAMMAAEIVDVLLIITPLSHPTNPS